MSIWELVGDSTQQRLVNEALARCDFPFDLLKPSLEKEGKKVIQVTWEDLSRFTVGAVVAVHHEELHAVSREVDGRMRVLGLFYLPPHTRVVLDTRLATNPALAYEVFLAEGAHAIDYHYMTPAMRVAAWNALHPFDNLSADTVIQDSGDVAHGHSWFDGPGGYSTWVGESMMGLLIAAFSPSVSVTTNLAHTIDATATAATRAALLRPVFDEALLKAVRRLLARPKYAPRYLLTAWDQTLSPALVAALRRFVTRGSAPAYIREAWKMWRTAV